MAAAIKTPGVYIVEKNAFPNSVVEVATAVPAFIGYTEKRPDPADKIIPTRLSSFAEYEKTFGGAPVTQFTFTAPNKVDVVKNSQFLLHSSMRLFFDNGGGPCWIVSIGTYDSASTGDKKPGDFTAALPPLEKILEPTMLVAPDAILLDQPGWQTVCQQFLAHCGKMQSRVSLLDVYDGDKERTYHDDDVINQFRNSITSDFLNYGQTYYPWVNTSIVEDSDVDYGAIQGSTLPLLQTTLKNSIANIAQPARSAIADVIDLMPVGTAVQKLLSAASRLDEPQKTNVTGLIEQWNKQPTAENKGALDTAVGNLPDSDKIQKLIEDWIAAPTDAGKTKALNDEVAKLSDTDQANIKKLIDAVKSAAADKDREEAAKTAKAALVAAGKLNYPQTGKVADGIKDVEKAKADVISPRKKAMTDAVNALPSSLASNKTSILAALPWGDGKNNPADATAKSAQTTQASKTTDLTSLNTEIGKLPEPQKSTLTILLNRAEPPSTATPSLTQIHRSLRAVSQTYVDVMGEIRTKLNLLPPSGGMAGVYTRVDNTIGVFKAPANTGMSSVVSPAVDLTSADQEDLNMPLDGKAINAIRAFPGRGVLIWGARTLDGNSQDWRYINVRRTIIMLEQSVKFACLAYVFEPNAASTWVTVRNMITNFLTNQWKAGALVGAKPEEAFSVDVGLGSTMTADDILNGFMNVTIKVALVRPAEFIVITFQQKMQTS